MRCRQLLPATPAWQTLANPPYSPQKRIDAENRPLGYNPRWIKPMLSVMSSAKAKEMLFTGRS